MPDSKSDGAINVMGLAKNLLIIVILLIVVVILLAVLAGIVLVILNLNNLSGMMDSITHPQGSNGNSYNPNNQNSGSSNYNNNGNYNPNNGSGQSSYGQGNQTQNDQLSNLGIQLKEAVDQGDWSKANNIMSQVKSMSSQLPPEIASLVPQFEQAIQNRDQGEFNRLYEQVQSSMSSNYVQNQGNSSQGKGNYPGAFSCNAGDVYSGNVPNAAAHVNATITGMMFHNSRDMCHFSYQISEQGMNADEDCFFDQKETCCTVSIGGMAQGQETCVAMSG